jgi:hypothetical protein
MRSRTIRVVLLEPGEPGVAVGDTVDLVALDLETRAKTER